MQTQPARPPHPARRSAPRSISTSPAETRVAQLTKYGETLPRSHVRGAALAAGFAASVQSSRHCAPVRWQPSHCGWICPAGVAVRATAPCPSAPSPRAPIAGAYIRRGSARARPHTRPSRSRPRLPSTPRRCRHRRRSTPRRTARRAAGARRAARAGRPSGPRRARSARPRRSRRGRGLAHCAAAWCGGGARRRCAHVLMYQPWVQVAVKAAFYHCTQRRSETFASDVPHLAT
jgi:hypothetical protein